MNLDNYILISQKGEVMNFIKGNENAEIILKSMDPHLFNHFPKSQFSLEISNSITWTTERKLLVNISVSEEMFFNGILGQLCDIYEKINPLIEDILCPIVLFPELSDKAYDKFGRDSTINLIAKTAYFNNDFDPNLQREMTLREIPKPQMKREIIEYCKSHPILICPISYLICSWICLTQTA